MKYTVLFFSFLFCLGARAEDTVTAAFQIGLGYQVCAKRDTPPPLETAYLCPGMVPTLQQVQVVMKPVKTAKPQWKMWSGTYVDNVVLDKIVMKVELLVSMSIVDGKYMVYIDGRLGNNKVPGQTYFRLAAEDSFKKLHYTTVYGMPYRELYEGTVLENAPHMVIAAP